VNTSYRNILLIALLATVAAGIVLSGAGGAAQALAALPLALLLPGYAFAAAALPAAAISRAERIALSFGLSLGISVLGGFALDNLPGGLNASSWAIFLCAVTLLSCAIATARERARDPQGPPASLGRISVAQGVQIVLAVLIGIGALQMARTGAEQLPQVAFTQLWMLPQGQADHRTLSLGITNAEGAPVAYRLVLAADGAPVQEWSRIELAPQQQWAMSIPMSAQMHGASTIAARLYRIDQPSTIYRQAVLRADVQDGSGL